MLQLLLLFPLRKLLRKASSDSLIHKVYYDYESPFFAKGLFIVANCISVVKSQGRGLVMGFIRFRKVTSVFLMSVVIILMSSSCVQAPIIDQGEVLNTLQELYPDDRFSVVDQNPGGIIIRSENFSDSNIYVEEREDGLYSSYLHEYYENQIDEYFTELTCEYFDSKDMSGVSVYWNTSVYFPLEEISEEDFMREYVYNEIMISVYYDDLESFPDRESLTEYIIGMVDELDAPCRIEITLYVLGESTYDCSTSCTVVADRTDHIESLDISDTRMVTAEG